MDALGKYLEGGLRDEEEPQEGHEEEAAEEHEERRDLRQPAHSVAASQHKINLP
jgi:hypothetical protein